MKDAITPHGLWPEAIVKKACKRHHWRVREDYTQESSKETIVFPGGSRSFDTPSKLRSVISNLEFWNYCQNILLLISSFKTISVIRRGVTVIVVSFSGLSFVYRRILRNKFITLYD